MLPFTPIDYMVILAAMVLTPAGFVGLLVMRIKHG